MTSPNTRLDRARTATRALAALLVAAVTAVAWFGFGASMLVSSFPIGMPDSGTSPQPQLSDFSLVIWWQLATALSAAVLMASLILSPRHIRSLSLVWVGILLGFSVATTAIAGFEWIVLLDVPAAVVLTLWLRVLTRAA